MNRDLGKEVVLAGAVLLVGAGLWWTAARMAASPNLLGGVLVGAAALAWVVSTALLLALAANRVLLISTLLATLLLLVGAGRASVGAISAAIILAGLLPAARWRVREELSIRKKYQTFPAFSAGARLLVLSVLIGLAGLSLFAVADELSTRAIAVPEHVVREAVIAAVPAVAGGNPVDTGALMAATTSALNQYLTTVVQSNPLLTASVALITALFLFRLLVPLLAWPAVSILALTVWLGRRVGVFSLLEQEEITETLIL